MSDDTAQLFLGKIIPVSPMASRGVSEKASFAQSVSLGPFRQDEKRAFAGGEVEIIRRCTLTINSENFPESEFGMSAFPCKTMTQALTLHQQMVLRFEASLLMMSK